MSHDYGERSRAALWLIAALVLLFLIIPVLVVIPVSFNPTRFLQFPPPEWSLTWYESLVTSEAWLSAVRRSIVVGLIAVGVATPVGTLAAIGLVRGRYPGKSLIRGVIMMPLTVPVIVLSIGIYNLFSDLRLIGTSWGLGLAHAMLGLPFVVLVVSSAVQNLDATLEHAAWTLGATRTSAFFKITLPLLRQAMVAASLFVFIVSFDEVVIAVFVAGVAGETLPVRIFSFLRTEISPVIAAISTLLISGLFLLAVVGRLASHRRQGARFDDHVQRAEY